MMAGIRERLAGTGRLLLLCARIVAGRRFWAVPLLTLVWPAFQALRLLVGWQPEAFDPADAQTVLIAFPLTLMAMLMGVRVIAGEIDLRTLEIAYTVPGGAHRVWLAKLAAALGILLAAEALLAIATFVFFTAYPAGALYGALQAGLFYLVLAMAVSTLFRSEATGALITVGMLSLNGLLTGFGGVQMRLSPFWNPAEPTLQQRYAAAEVMARTVQNRIAILLIIAALMALTFGRAERREKMLSG